jgi:hypothetical protein
MTDDARAVAGRMYEAFNARDYDSVSAIFSADFVSHALGTTGAGSVTEAWTRMHATFPSIRVVVEDMIVDGGRVAVRTTLHGLPADRRPVPEMLEMFRVHDGRIAELWGLSTLGRTDR